MKKAEGKRQKAEVWSVMKNKMAIVSVFLAFAFCLLPFALAQQASPVSPSVFAEMKWRAIGPSRGGRTKAAAGHASQPYTFYMAAVNGGVWKTTDAGRTWKPIFDDQPTGSIGTVVVAPSDPNVVYVGTGEGLARPEDRKSTRLNSSHVSESRMPSSA